MTHRSRAFGLFLFFLVGALQAQRCGAGTRTVTTLTDETDGSDNLLSLREAIAASANGDIINFASGLIGTIVLTNELVIGRDLTITGPGAASLAVSGTISSRVFNIVSGVFNLSGMTITNGYILADSGGGFYNAGTLILSNCLLAGNGTEQVFGGGIYNAGTATLYRCTLSGNHSVNADGGGIYNAGQLTLSTCTFYGNKCSGSGGAVYNRGTLTVNNSTISGGNNGTFRNANYGGGIFNAGSATLRNTIIAGDSVFNGGTGPDCQGTFTSGGFNLIGATNGSTGWIASDLTGSSASPLDPLLSPLQDNGGPTVTLALLPGSAAIDAGGSGGAPTDQRGAPRPNDNPAIPNAPGGDGSDIGAFEVSPKLNTKVAGSGVLLKNPDQVFYQYNTNVVLTAMPDLGWVFSGWLGSASGTINPLSVAMTDDKSVTANFTATATACCPLPANALLWWPGGNNANDIISGYNGTLFNGVSYASGKVGQGFSFDGVAGYAEFGGSAGNFYYNDFTIEFWMETSATNPEVLLGKRPVCGYASFWDILVNQSGVIQAELCQDNTGLNYELITGQHVVNDGAFHHVAMVRQDVNFLVYVDGALEGATNTTAAVLLYNGARTLAGRSPCTGSYGFQYYQGLLDDLTIYYRALSQAEIQGVYNAGASGKCLTPIYLTSLDKTETNANLTWLAQPGLTYRAQYKTDLNAPTAWSDVSGDVTATNTSASKTDALPPNSPQRFYQVELFR